MGSKKTDGTVQKKHINYLFKGFYNNNDKLVGGLRPLPYITFAAETLVPEDPEDFKNEVSAVMENLTPISSSTSADKS